MTRREKKKRTEVNGIRRAITYRGISARRKRHGQWKKKTNLVIHGARVSNTRRTGVFFRCIEQKKKKNERRKKRVGEEEEKKII